MLTAIVHGRALALSWPAIEGEEVARFITDAAHQPPEVAALITRILETK